VGGAPADAVGGFAGEFAFFAAFFAPPGRQLSAWWFEDPVVDAFGHDLECFSLGHGITPWDDVEVFGLGLRTPPPAGASVCRAYRRFQSFMANRPACRAKV